MVHLRSVPSSGSAAQDRSTPAGEPAVLLVTSDPRLHDEVALLAAVVGARLDIRTCWEHTADGDRIGSQWAALMCGPDALPPEAVHHEVLLLSASDDGAPAPSALWGLATKHPSLRPVPLPEGEEWLTEQLRTRLTDQLPGRVVAVVGAGGGTGASTIAYLMAGESVARGSRVLLIDADSSAGSGLRALGEQSRRSGAIHGAVDTLGWQSLARIEGTLAASQLTGALPVIDGIHLITGEIDDDAPPAPLGAVVAAGRRAFDLVVVDCARRASVTEALGGPPDAGVVVAEPSSRGRAAVAEVPLRGHGVDWSLVANGPARSGWTGAEIARQVGLPLAAELAEQRWLRRAPGLGEAYELLRTRRGEAFTAALLEAVGASDA